MSRASKGNKSFRIHISGKVQGVGFRPFIYRQARSLGLNGFVANTGAGAAIEVQGKKSSVKSFLNSLETNTPPNSKIDQIRSTEIPVTNYTSFTILKSLPAGSISADIPPDLCLCPACAKDIYSKTDRRYQYPFTNCTNCGPRFSIIKTLPYDRNKTTMKRFKMCPDCGKEYNDPCDRRFHAQPNACPVCGPKLTLLSRSFRPLANGTSALTKTAELLKSGRIVAVKSIGGYHIACDAFNRKAVKLLRERKKRPYKPFALMMPDAETVKKYCLVNNAEAALLNAPASPIVLLRARKNTGLPLDLLAPGNAYLGVMIAYTPLHTLMFNPTGENKKVFNALVMSSGNKTDEPISIEETALREKLAGIADNFLTHDRPIYNRCDDSIVFNLREKDNIFIRKSRGYVPEPVNFAVKASPSPAIFAAGAELKNTFCLTRGPNAYPSQYIGDLDNLEASKFYREAFLRMREFLAIKPGVIAYDLHPDYYSTGFARKMISANPKLKGVAVQHHHAHIASVLAEKDLPGPVIGIAFDGNGMGADGNVWGGECLLVNGRGFERLAHLDYFHLPGGDIAVKEIWRLAASFARKYSLNGLPKTVTARDPGGLISAMMEKNINSPLCSSMGRLFDAVAAIIGIRQVVSFEAQAAMELEALAIDIPVKKGYNFEVILRNDERGFSAPAVLSVKPLLEGILKDLHSGFDKRLISAKFHFTVAEIIYELAVKFGRPRRIKDIVLSGGVFQNKVLLGLAVKRLERARFKVHFNTVVPPNDGGISLGQAYIAYQKDKFQ